MEAPVLLDFLAYSRASVDAGQWWRLATASLAHLSLAHLAANAAAAALLGMALRTRLSVREALLVVAGSAVAAGAGVHLLTRLDWYAGLSGALWGLAGYGACRIGCDRVFRCMLLGTMALVVAIDQERALSWLGEPLAPQAHLFGFGAGLVLAAARGLREVAQRQRLRSPATTFPGARLPPGSPWYAASCRVAIAPTGSARPARSPITAEGASHPAHVAAPFSSCQCLRRSRATDRQRAVRQPPVRVRGRPRPR